MNGGLFDTSLLVEPIKEVLKAWKELKDAGLDLAAQDVGPVAYLAVKVKVDVENGNFNAARQDVHKMTTAAFSAQDRMSC